MDRYFKTVVMTQKGIELLNKTIVTKGSIEFTRIGVGVGRPGSDDDMVNMSEIVDWVLDIPVKASISGSVTHKVIGTLDNRYVEQSFYLTELGLYAKDEDGLEVLYSYTYTDYGEYVPSSRDTWLVREFTINTTISQTEDITINIDDNLIYATMQDLKELSDRTLPYLNFLTIQHNLNGYPLVQALATEFGAGLGGAGENPAGNITKSIPITIEYIDKNSLRVLLTKEHFFHVQELNIIDSKHYIAISGLNSVLINLKEGL